MSYTPNTSQELLDLRPEILTTDNLVLRAPIREDATDIAALANDMDIASMLMSLPHPYGIGDAEAFIRNLEEADGKSCAFVITDARSGELMGVCGLGSADEDYDHPHMGYWLGKSYWGHGYATEAARAVVDFYFKTGTHDQLMLSVLPGNERSIRVIEKCGGEFVGCSQRYLTVLDEERQIDHYRITRENWMGAIAA